MEAKLYNQKGEAKGNVSLPESVFDQPWNADLVHQVITSMQGNEREAIAHTKTRGEVRGGGKKPWQQKGTGRARHGSTRSPIWVGGGVAHGPRNDKNFARKINKKMKAKALYTILSQKYRDGEILFIDALSFAAPKTKDAKGVISAFASLKGAEKLKGKRKNAAFIGIPTREDALMKSFQNFGNIEVDELRNLNPLTAMNYKYIIISNPKESLKAIENKLANK